MTNTSELKFFGKPDWKWVGVSYCFFVVFHMLPTVLMTGMSRSGMGLGWNVGTVIWMFFGLTLIGGYVGYKSAGVTILEPAISSMAYMVTLIVCMQFVWGLPFRLKSTATSGAVILAGTAIVLVSAWIGEIVQSRKQREGMRV